MPKVDEKMSSKKRNNSEEKFDKPSKSDRKNRAIQRKQKRELTN